MPAFDLTASTIRAGFQVDEISFEVPNAPDATGYLLGQSEDPDQRIVLGLHDARGDKASLLTELEHLAARGFMCLSIDSPITRRASAERDPLTAFESQLAIATAALELLHADAADHERHTALVGHGIGAEVAAHLATTNAPIQVVVASGALVDRCEFIRTSTHPLAAGMRQFNDDDGVARQLRGLEPYGLGHQLTATPDTHWLLQVADDDDRYSAQDRATLSLGIPRTVRVDHVQSRRDLGSRAALRTRVDFISRLC